MKDRRERVQRFVQRFGIGFSRGVDNDMSGMTFVSVSFCLDEVMTGVKDRMLMSSRMNLARSLLQTDYDDKQNAGRCGEKQELKDRNEPV